MGAGDRLRRVLDGPHHAHGLACAAICSTRLPRRVHPESAAADSHARRAAWRERYRGFQHNDCSTKRDYGSPIRVTSRFTGRPRVIWCARVEQSSRVPTAKGGRAAPIRLPRQTAARAAQTAAPADVGCQCAGIQFSKPLGSQRFLRTHKSTLCILPEMVFGNSMTSIAPG
jgi:hypothetical protein